MRLTTAELENLRLTVRDLLGKFHPAHGVRDSAADARARMWAGLADQLGLSGLGIAEEYGGVGEQREVRQMVLEELGRALVPGPAFSTLAVARLIAASGHTETAAQCLPEIATGALTAGFSVSEGISARPESGDRWLLHGEVRTLIEGVDADIIVVLGTPAADSGAPRAFLVDVARPGVSITPIGSTDPTRALASLVLDGTEATALGELDARRTVALIAQDLAFEQLGGARWCLETTRDYAKLRSQFGRTIGSFQAVKHLLADVVLENEAAWAAAAGIQDEVDSADEQSVLAGSVVHTLASEAYLRAAGTAVQVHGAIAITDETDVHLHFKRATTGRQMLGGMSRHYQCVIGGALASIQVRRGALTV